MIDDFLDRSFLVQSHKDWLYGKYDKDKLYAFTALYSVPGIRQYMDFLLDMRANEEYLNRYGMNYSDIHDPRKLTMVRSGAAVAGSALNFVSRNVTKLYR